MESVYNVCKYIYIYIICTVYVHTSHIFYTYIYIYISSHTYIYIYIHTHTSYIYIYELKKIIVYIERTHEISPYLCHYVITKLRLGKVVTSRFFWDSSSGVARRGRGELGDFNYWLGTIKHKYR